MTDLPDHLSQQERRLLARASVFADGFTESAAKAVCAIQPLSEIEVATGLRSLTEQSLIESNPDTGRFHLSARAAQVAASTLDESGEKTAMVQSLAKWCLSLASLTSRNIHGADQAAWLERVGSEIGNIRSVLSSPFIAPAVALQVGASIVRYWMISGQYQEGVDTLTKLVSACDEKGNEDFIGHAYVGIANCCWLIGDTETARKHFTLAAEKCLTQNPDVLAPALNGLGNVLAYDRRYDEARQAYVEACSLNCLSGNRALEAMNLSNIGETFLRTGDLDNAEDYFRESEAANIEIGNVAGLLYAYFKLASIAVRRGDTTRAIENIVLSLGHSHEIKERAVTTNCIALLGALALRTGSFERAGALTGLSIRLSTSVGYEPEDDVAELLRSTVAQARLVLGQERFNEALQRFDQLDWQDVYEASIREARSLATFV